MPSDPRSPWTLLVPLGLAPLAANAVGSVFNIWYNQRHLAPALTAEQAACFRSTVLAFNALVYPVAVWIWVRALVSLREPVRRRLAGEPVDADALHRARRRAIHLPWIPSLAGAIAWFACIPVFLGALRFSTSELASQVWIHLPISFLVGGSIAVTHGYFSVELLSQRRLIPLLFEDADPSTLPGLSAPGLRTRGLVWAFAAIVCPIASLLLLVLAPLPGQDAWWFSLLVGLVAMSFGLTTAGLITSSIARPVRQLAEASRRVGAGDLEVRIPPERADEFGQLASEFNHMVSELREKERVRELFGRHVGREAALEILARDGEVQSRECELTVLFADLRGFTKRSSHATPAETVALLNRFFTAMVEIIEGEEKGLLNKFLGDGLLALFGVRTGPEGKSHADRALSAARAMQARLGELNRELTSEGSETLTLGIGLHSGPVVLGSMGSPERLEYTAIGDTVNVAARIEGLTKKLGRGILLSQATRAWLGNPAGLEDLPPQEVQGKDEPIVIYSALS